MARRFHGGTTKEKPDGDKKKKIYTWKVLPKKTNAGKRLASAEKRKGKDTSAQISYGERKRNEWQEKFNSEEERKKRAWKKKIENLKPSINQEKFTLLSRVYAASRKKFSFPKTYRIGSRVAIGEEKYPVGSKQQINTEKTDIQITKEMREIIKDQFDVGLADYFLILLQMYNLSSGYDSNGIPLPEGSYISSIKPSILEWATALENGTMTVEEIIADCRKKVMEDKDASQKTKNEFLARIDQLEKSGFVEQMTLFANLWRKYGPASDYKGELYDPIFARVKKTYDKYGPEQTVADEKLWEDIFKIIENADVPKSVRDEFMQGARQIYKTTIQLKEIVPVITIIKNIKNLEKKAAAEAVLQSLTGLTFADASQLFGEAVAREIDLQFNPLEFSLQHRGTATAMRVNYQKKYGLGGKQGLHSIEASFLSQGYLGKNMYVKAGLGISTQPLVVPINSSLTMVIRPENVMGVVRLSLAKRIRGFEVQVGTSLMAMQLGSIGIGNPQKPANPVAYFVPPEFSAGGFKNIIGTAYVSLEAKYSGKTRNRIPYSIGAGVDAFPRIGFAYYDANKNRVLLPSNAETKDIENIAYSKAALLGAGVVGKLSLNIGNELSDGFALLSNIHYSPQTGSSSAKIYVQTPAIARNSPQFYASLQATAMENFKEIISLGGSAGMKWKPIESFNARIIAGANVSRQMRPGAYFGMQVDL